MEVPIVSSGVSEPGILRSGGIRATSSQEIQRPREPSGQCIVVPIEQEMKPSFYGPSANALSRKSIFSYGTGHMLNDLTAACWFTYLLIFLRDVGLSPQQAAGVMLAGQVADGIATILVGRLIDKFGHFKLWHAGGTILVAISFSSVFGGCYVCDLLGTTSLSAITLGYGVFAAIFNIGWAATQVSHMSLVNCITANPSSRVSLNSCRNAFSMVANLCLYAIAYVIFWTLPGASPQGVHLQYKWIAWISIFIGSCFVLLFLCGVREPRLSHHCKAAKDAVTKTPVTTWFHKLLYYQVAAVYTLTRLTTNVSQALLSFYLIDDLAMGESSKAVVPAIIYVCSFLTSLVLQELHWNGHRLKFFFAVGSFLWILSGALLYVLPAAFKSSVFGVASIIGLGSALMLVTATSIQGILVGHDLSGVAFVYGSLSFMDKITCGFALYLIEGLNVETRSCRRHLSDLSICNGSIIRSALGLVPSGCALLAVLVTLTMNLGETDREVSSLRKPLLAAEESSIDNDQDEASVLKSNGTTSAAENTRTSSRPILPPRAASFRRYKPFEGEQVVDQDIERNRREVSGAQLTWWETLESATVGRWGSIRKTPAIWLE